jgi:hypothetical protein
MQKQRKPTQRKVGRDAKTGQFKSKEYVKKRPDTTIEETVRAPKPKKGKKRRSPSSTH